MNCEFMLGRGKTRQKTDLFRLVFVHDPTDSGDYVIPIGKQTLHQGHIFYTPCSGIWQSVFIEPVQSNHITGVDLDGNMDGQGVHHSL